MDKYCYITQKKAKHFYFLKNVIISTLTITVVDASPIFFYISGEKCIAVNKQWFTPTEFERFAGKQSSKNWKVTIRCVNTPLGKLIEVC